MGLLNKILGNQKTYIRVCMMGPKAVGKTTVLTAIFNDTKESIARTNLILKSIGDTGAQLTDKRRLLEATFKNKQTIKEEPVSYMPGSHEISNFHFDFGLKGREAKIEIEIKDFPGEYVLDNPDQVMAFIESSDTIMIAIDTPHLMEMEGRFNEAKNKISIITRFLKERISGINDEKLILLVPLKCEKYFFEKRMDEVKEQVIESYKELIQFFKESTNENIACAITPILTLGGVIYDTFDIANGQVILDSKNPLLPAHTIYKFKDEGATYSPSFCVQPLYYLLSFVVTQYERNKGKGGFLNKLRSLIFQLFENDKELFNEILKMEQNRRSDLPGYQMICGANKFHYNRH